MVEVRWALRGVSFTARRRDHGAGRAERRRQDDDHLPAAAPVRPDGRARHHRRARPERRDARLAGGPDRDGHARDASVPRHDPGQPALRQVRGDAGGDRSRLPGANIHDFIAGLPDGSRDDRRGAGLPPRRREAGAWPSRVLLKDPGILVLDEATAHLDSQAEALIQQALEVAMRAGQPW